MAETIAQDKSADSRLRGLLAAFRQIGAPLAQALAETKTDADAPPKSETFGKLVDDAIALSRELSAQLGATEDSLDAWVRWALVGAASQIVAANYKATGHALPPEEITRLAGTVLELQKQFRTQIPEGNEPAANTAAAFRAKVMEALVPVVGAVAQYAFGRAEHLLLAEIAEKLVKTADQVTRALAPSGCSSEEWRLLCWNILRAAGQIYTECHYAEADRLLYLSPEDRAAYFAQHGQVPPMTQVWQAFNQRMAMLATLATYLDVPETAGLDRLGWQA